MGAFVCTNISENANRQSVCTYNSLNLVRTININSKVQAVWCTFTRRVRSEVLSFQHFWKVYQGVELGAVQHP